MPWNMAEVMITIIFTFEAIFELFFFSQQKRGTLVQGSVSPKQIKLIIYQNRKRFFATDEGLELSQSFWEDEQKLVEKKFARLEAKGDKIETEKREEIEEERRTVKENLAKVKDKRGRKVAEAAERDDQGLENGSEV